MADARTAPDGAPNVLFIVLDDVGFGQLRLFGGPSRRRTSTGSPPTGCATPTCTPRRCARRRARACLTGRNHHSQRHGGITELATGLPRLQRRSSRSRTAILSEMLLPHGYNTFMVGKWHLTPPEHETPAGPYDRWPLGRGFERFYGFLGGDTNQWYPDLVYDNHQVEPPTQPGGGLPPDRRPGRQGDRVHRRRQAGQRARQAVLPVLLHRARRTRPTTSPKEWADRYTGRVRRRLGRLPRDGRSRQQQLELGIVPAGAELSRHDPDVPRWDDAARRRSSGCTPG